MTDSAWVSKSHRHDRSRSSEDAHRRAEAASYIADLSGDLAALARKHGLDALGFILEMARLEADNTVRHGRGGR
jgi:hypothetical protein